MVVASTVLEAAPKGPSGSDSSSASVSRSLAGGSGGILLGDICSGCSGFLLSGVIEGKIDDVVANDRGVIHSTVD